MPPNLSIVELVVRYVREETASLAITHVGMHGPGTEFDTDGNGKLSVQECTAQLKATQQPVTSIAARFTATDVNAYGSLSSAESNRALFKSPATAKPNSQPDAQWRCIKV